MTIYIDADACPVTRIAETIAKKHGIQTFNRHWQEVV